MFWVITIVAVLFATSNAFLINIPSLSQTTEIHLHCEAQRFIKCFQESANVLNIPKSVDTPAELFEYIKEFTERSGRNAFAAVCIAAHVLEDCFGDAFDDCTSVRGMMEMGVNETDAYAYAEFVGELQYECGAGFNVWYDNLECIGNVTSSKDYLNWEAECTKMLEEKIKINPDNMCEYFREFTGCFSQPIAVECGRPAGNAICNTIVSGFIKADKECEDLNCDYLK